MRRMLLSDDTEFGKKYTYAQIFIVVSFLILIGRMVQLQIFYGAQYRELSKDNFLQKRSLESPRGKIFDRYGEVLAENIVSFNVFITPLFFKERSFKFLINLLDLPQSNIDYIQLKIMTAEGRRRGYSLMAIRDIPKEWAIILESNRDFLRGLEIVPLEKRFYPQGSLASHALGFVGEISREDMDKYPEKKYRPQEWRGKYGLEWFYEDDLRGKKGYVWRILDAKGRRIRSKSSMRWLPSPWKVEPKPGKHLHLTIDSRLQRIVERSFSIYEAGAAIVLEVNTGKILAYTSKPSFDPNELSGKLTPARAHEIYANPLHPMLDKVSQGTYFPGSTYKVIPAFAAIEENLVDLSEYHLCKGWYEYGRNSSFRCTHAHGLMNMDSSIYASCNVFFYMLSERVGMDRMSRYARLLGFGTPTGLGLNYEKGGFIPTKQWYAQKFMEGFRIGHTLNSAIGQGNTKVTVVQSAMVYAAIANRGKIIQPQIIEKITDFDGNTIQGFQPIVKRTLDFKPENFEFMIKSLAKTVSDPHGTAHKSQLRNITVAGKTGTAQVRKLVRDKVGKTKAKWRHQDHAWFAGFSPVDKPEIVVVVLIEHVGMYASKAAVPLTMRIIKNYFRIKKNRTK
jgi:penicillin-binding protein 2